MTPHQGQTVCEGLLGLAIPGRRLDRNLPSRLSCSASLATRENRPDSMGVVWAIAWADHWRWVSRPRCAWASSKVTSFEVGDSHFKSADLDFLLLDDSEQIDDQLADCSMVTARRCVRFVAAVPLSAGQPPLSAGRRSPTLSLGLRGHGCSPGPPPGFAPTGLARMDVRHSWVATLRHIGLSWRGLLAPTT
jgi:hypothetical protein